MTGAAGGADDSRGRIVAAGLALFCARGFAAVGTQEICETAGVLKGTLYHFFPSKIDVALAALEHYGAGVAATFRRTAASRASPRRKLAKVFEASRDAAAGHRATGGAVYGCLHGNLALELSATDDRVRACLQAITAEWAAALVPIVEELIAAGDIPACDPDAAADTILAYLHGVVMAAKTANDPAVITRMGKHAVGLLGGAVTPGG